MPTIRFQPFLLVALCLTGSLPGLASSHPRREKPVDSREERKLAREVEADAHALVEANNRFALDLYAELRAQPGNLFLSPYSISTAFGMLRAGAAGKTEVEMASVFHFTLPQEKLHPAFGALRRS